MCKINASTSAEISWSASARPSWNPIETFFLNHAVFRSTVYCNGSQPQTIRGFVAPSSPLSYDEPLYCEIVLIVLIRSSSRDAYRRLGDFSSFSVSHDTGPMLMQLPYRTRRSHQIYPKTGPTTALHGHSLRGMILVTILVGCKPPGRRHVDAQQRGLTPILFK